MKDWEEATSLFGSIGATTGRALTVADGVTEPERHLGAAISWDLFPLLGVSPAFGRGFTADDDRPGAADVVILSDILWHRRYHADSNVLGRSILINGKPHTVIGIMPPNFPPENQRLWIPLEPTTIQDRRDARACLRSDA